MKKVTFLASIGSALEYFDFVIYGMMAGYLSKLFFPLASESMRLVQIFSVFAVGYLARPLGGILFGMLGDHLGRSKIFLYVMLLMGAATLGIAFLPTYEKAGLFAAVLLTFCRLLQGISFGAELPGAITVISEFSEEKKQSRNCSFVISSTCLGSITASLLLFVLTKYFQEEAILAWGWRIPFFVGGLFAFILFFLRKLLPETPIFIKQHTSLKEPLQQLVKEHRSSIFLGFGSIFFTSLLIIVNISYPAYLSTYLHYPLPDVYFATMLSLIYAALILPFFGWLCDCLGKKSVFLTTTFLFAIGGGFLLKYLAASHLLLFMLVNQTFICASMISFFPFLTELFPTSVRYTGVAFSYNMAYFFAALSPMLFSYILTIAPRIEILFWALSLAALLSFISGLFSVLLKKELPLQERG